MKLFKRRTPQLDDEASLARKCAAGDATAQRTLYEQYKTKMFGVCLRYSVDRTMAEDVLQESFITAFRTIHKYEGRGSLEGWLRRITVGAAIDYHRKHKRPLLYIDTLPDNHTQDVEAEVLACLETEALLACLQHLPDGYRLVFNMYVVEGYTHTEIANTLGITESASRSQLTRARRAFVQILEKNTLIVPNGINK